MSTVGSGALHQEARARDHPDRSTDMMRRKHDGRVRDIEDSVRASHACFIGVLGEEGLEKGGGGQAIGVSIVSG